MSSYYPDSEDPYDLYMAFGKPGHLQLPMSDQWRQHRGPLDPTSSPSSSYSPALSLASSPMTPRGSPTVTRQLKKSPSLSVSDLALDNEQLIPCDISPILTGSPYQQTQPDERNHASRVDNLQLLGPSITRRSQALSADNFQGEHHMSMIRPHKHGLEHRSAPPRSQGSHSNTYASFIPMPANILDLSDIEGFPGLDTNFNLFTDDEPTPTDIMVSADNSTTNAGLSAVNDNLFGLPSHLTVPFSAFLRLPLTAPHEACYSQQPPPPPVKQVAGGSVSKDSDSIAAVWSCYYQHFKHNQPFLRRLDQKFRKKVGSLKTVQASLDKRKDEGHWVCPLGCSDFTRKQNLKHHLQSHLGIKDFDCNCGAQFNALSGLKRHKKKCRTSQLSVTN